MVRLKKVHILTFFLFLLLAFTAGRHTGRAAGAPEPGSADDPLVTLSYLQQYVKEQGTSGGGVDSHTYTVVTLQPGQFLEGKEGTEIILRAGNAEAVCSVDGMGVSNVTQGVDLGQNFKNDQVPLNHLLIIPRSDGRGIKGLPTGSDGGGTIYLMVRGDYNIR